MYEKLNETFDKIFVITVENVSDICGGIDRKKQVEERFEGLNYEFFYGVDGRYIDKEYYESLGSTLSHGQLGCTLSHLNLYKKILDENIDKVLLLEDDCYFCDEIENFDRYYEQLPTDWEMVYLGYLSRTQIGYGIPVSKNVFKIEQSNVFHVEGTQSLMLRKSFVERLYEFNRNAMYAADYSLTEIVRQKGEILYGFYPSLSNQFLVDPKENYSITGYIDIEIIKNKKII